MKKILLIVFLLFAGGSALAAPLSDLAEDQFDKGPTALKPSSGSPFVPIRRAGDDVDATMLKTEGIVCGKDLKIALLSGRIVQEGDSLGRYKVKEIHPSGVVLSLGSSLYHLKIEDHVASFIKKKGTSGYTVEFYNASLRDALKLLTKGAGLNLMLPEDLSGRVTLSFEDMDLLETIRSILRVNGYEYAMESGVVRVGKADAFVGGANLTTVNYRLKYATARDLVEKVKVLLSDKGSVVSDDRTNTLTVKDRDAVIANISSLVSIIDGRDQQVQIEARIVDASHNFSRSLGIRWGVSSQSGQFSTAGSTSAGTHPDTNNPLNVNLGASEPTSAIGFIIGRLAGNTNIEAQITAAEQKGDVQILSKPTVSTLNNMPARIRSGTKIYVKSTSSISVGTAGGTAANAGTSGLQEIDTGIDLTVTPQIATENAIRLKIVAVESEADFSRTVDGIPAVLDNQASTTVLLKDGDTTVIGGLYRVRTSKEKRGVPGLSKIPVMGLLFQSKTRTKSDNELMIFITPRILQP